MSTAAISHTYHGEGLSGRLLTFERAGDVHDGHCHIKDHWTVVAMGKVRCEVAGCDPIEVEAPNIIPIPGDRRHKFTALADNTAYFCIFAGDDPGDAAACSSCSTSQG